MQNHACKWLVVGLLGLGGTATAQTQAAPAQNAASDTQRDANQQQRIDQGLKSGQLNTRQASNLEQREANLDRTEQRDMRNGTMTKAENAQIQHMQNRDSAAIYKDKHDATTGNPNSASSRRLQADVRRNANQEQRLAHGVKSGQLTHREDARMQGRQAHVDHMEHVAGASNGRVGPREQQRIQHADNRDSKRIHRVKHNQAKR
ncbi:hypothetical protein [Rhodanobacter geophilus]|uniref:Uncharacterized protein n=1 Tax=Rhodanobacter geophilus TaxID=3162488 RepID=A0ABV3QJU7_9GAMM